MGEIVPPSNYIKANFYKIKVGKKHLKLSTYETDNLVNIYIGGPKLYCIHATVNKPNSIYVQIGMYEKTIGTIEQIYYNQQCSLEHNFIRGIDTNMIILLLGQYIKDKYPYVTLLKFNDASSRTCDNGTDISLAAMTYLYSGMTWYQKNFHAIIDPSKIDKYNGIVEKYNERKKLYSWDIFKEMFIKGQLPLPEEVMAEMFNSADTWQDFFGPLVNTIQIARFCNFMGPWLPKFIANVLKHDFLSIPYMFVLNKLRPVEYEILPFTNGGKRRNFTKKRLKSAPRNEM